jgi:hypothetical protein
MSRDQHEPSVGIFWLVRDKLLVDSTPVSRAEPYGDHLTHPRSHIGTWAQLQRLGQVPLESEYEEFARGRVMYHPALDEYTILADRCILSRKDLTEEIRVTLHLPEVTKLGTDAHYRCYHCLYGASDEWNEE